MKKLLANLFLFVAIFVVAVILLLLFAPVPEMRKTNMLNGIVQKDSLMEHVPQPRIIVIGGSNAAFGLNSRMIKDSLNVNPINASLHAGIGLVFAMNEARHYLKPGDVLIISPEYNQFFGEVAYGGTEALHVIFDVSLSNLKYLDFSNYHAFSNYLYYYLRSKIDEAGSLKKSELFYSDKAFNQYGDIDTHWPLERRKATTMIEILGEINPGVVEKVEAFSSEMEAKDIKVYLAYPGLQAFSFDSSRESIHQLDDLFRKYKLNLLGTPERYRMPDSLIFDTPYHLTEDGANYRTKRLIEDLRTAGYK
ncbi:hypothetical protein [Viscerimonas tarda]